ncbi:hypothetical protein BHE74_00053261, partial [Ensete ventricosum]
CATKLARGEEPSFSSHRDRRRFSLQSVEKLAGEDRDRESNVGSLSSLFSSPSSSSPSVDTTRNRSVTVEIDRYYPTTTGDG